jgi:tape measure domain-containing protein
MATADEIERIVVEIETQGADRAYVGVKRIDDLMSDLSKKKPADFLEGFAALENSLSKSLVDLPNMAALTDQAGKAWSRLVGEVRRYDEAQQKKHSRNVGLEDARREAQRFNDQMRAANRMPTALQQAPPSIDWAGALATQSQKAGSAIEAAAHSALEEAAAIGAAAKNATKLASVYDVIEKRAKAASKADSDWLADKMRAANRIPQELKETPKALSAGQKAFQSFARTFGPRATQGLTSTVETLEKIGPIAGKIGPPLASAAMAAGAIGIGLAGGAVYAAKSFSESVIHAQAYREDVRGAFEIIRRTQGDADKVLSLAASNADRLGIGRAEGVGQFLELLSKGFDPQKTKQIVGSLADLSTVDPKASIDSLTRVMGKIKAMGKLSQDSVSELSTAGLEAGDVYVQLAKATGKSQAEVQTMLSTGKIGADVGIEAVLAAINSQVGGGAAGDAAAKKADNNLSSLIRRVKDIPENILFDVQVGPGIDGVKDSLRSILDFFDVDKGKGKEVRQVAGDLFNALIEGLTGNKVDTKKGINGTLEAILAGAKEAVPVVKDLATGARDMLSLAAAFGSAASTVREFAAPLGGLSSIWKTLTFPLRALAATMLGPLTVLPELYSGFKYLSTAFDGATIGESFSSMWEQLKYAGANIINEGMNLGANLWQGLVRGIQGGIGAVVSSATSLANSALGAVGSTWRVGSPARAFEDLSLWAGAGTARGFDKGTPGAVAAATRMADASLGAAWAANPANANAGGGLVASGGAGAMGGNVFNFTANVIVSGASSPAQAQAAGAAAARGAREVFEAQYGSAMRRVRYG